MRRSEKAVCRVTQTKAVRKKVCIAQRPVTEDGRILGLFSEMEDNEAEYTLLTNVAVCVWFACEIVCVES